MAGNFKINQRLNINGELCTIRFIGWLPNWTDQEAIGLEWDHLERGKNDGSIDNVRYFTTRDGQKSGSFLKANSKKLINSSGVSFIRALCDKYGKGFENYQSYEDFFSSAAPSSGEGTEADSMKLTRERDSEFEEIKLGTKVVETYGFQRLDRLQSNFQFLEIVSLSSCNVASNNDEFRANEKIKISEILPNLKNLDLGYNLFHDLHELVWILQDTKIQKLNLNGNKWVSTSSPFEVPLFNSVIELSLADTQIKDLGFIAKMFPNVEQLNLASNDFDDSTDYSELQKLKNLKVLDLSYNRHQTINYKDFSKCSLQKLILSHNQVKITPAEIRFSNLTDLDVRSNSIEDWQEVDLLNIIFPNLKSLRISDNPITSENEEVEKVIDLSTFQLIARFDFNLQMLNRTVISASERENYELYFLSMLRKSPSDFKLFLETERFKTLCSVYKIDPSSISEQDLLNTTCGRLSSNLIDLRIEFKSTEISLKTFRYYTIGNLKGIISRILGISVIEFTIFYKVNKNLSEVLGNDLSMIQSTGISNGETICVQPLTET